MPREKKPSKYLYSAYAVNGDYQVVKYETATLFEESIYTLKYHKRNDFFSCDCIGFSHYKHCRHQEIMKIFSSEKKIGKGQLYDFDKKTWSEQKISMLGEEE